MKSKKRFVKSKGYSLDNYKESNNSAILKSYHRDNKIEFFEPDQSYQENNVYHLPRYTHSESRENEPKREAHSSASPVRNKIFDNSNVIKSEQISHGINFKDQLRSHMSNIRNQFSLKPSKEKKQPIYDLRIKHQS